MVKRRYLLLFAALVGCRTHKVHTAVPAPATSDDYLDLQPGWRLRAVLPVMKSGTLLAYESAYYAVRSQKQSGVWIQFSSALVTKDGRTLPETQAPNLSVPPRRMKYVRLLYLLRVSQSDHDMALIAVRRKEMLNDETRRIQADPANCRSADDFFCVWIPEGAAVRAERRAGHEDWAPVR